MKGKTSYIRPKVVGSFPGPGASGGYVHQAALLQRKGPRTTNPSRETGGEEFGNLSYMITDKQRKKMTYRKII
jgi:hypothetical protein